MPAKSLCCCRSMIVFKPVAKRSSEALRQRPEIGLTHLLLIADQPASRIQRRTALFQA